MQVEIRTIEAIPVACLPHRGPASGLDASVQQFIAWRKQTGLSPIQSCGTYGVAYDDPENTPPEAFRFDVCGAAASPIPANDFGVINSEISGGRYAVAVHQGSPDRIGETIWTMLRDWLPESGEELRDVPIVFHYTNLASGVPEHELLTDVYLPLRQSP